MKKLFNLLTLVLAVNFLALAGAVGWIVKTKGVDKEKMLAIKEIIVAGDLAVVRLTWTMTLKRKDTGAESGVVSTWDEYGLDVFRRQADGSWKIARYMSYDTLP